MDADDPVDSAFDDYLERALRGAAPGLSEFLAEQAGLETGARERLRLRIAALRGSRSAGDLPFERVGEFRLLARLGEGGMGVVFLAEQESTGQRVALKLLRPELSGSSEADRRFEREARAVAQIRHPNIVAVHAAGEAGGLRYLALELLEGQSLDEQLLANGAALEPARAVGIALDIARALGAAHASGVIHRDVKPSNVRIAPDGRALLVDFGLAQLDGASTLSRSGSFQGTPYYASPEQVDSRGQTLDARTDVYSLGATLYECVTGRRPFEGDSNAQVFQRILLGELVSPRRLEPRLSRDLETVILKALERRREQRYASAAELAADLEALLAMRPIRARPASRAQRARRWLAGRPLAAAALGTLLLGSLAGGVVLLVAAQRRAGEFTRALALADAALERRDFEGALSAYDRALGLAPQDAAALARRAQAQQAYQKSREQALLLEARSGLEAYRGHRAEVQALETGLEPLRRGITTRYLSPSEARQLARGEQRSRELTRGLEREFFAVVQGLELARSLDPADAGTTRLAADAYIERWREALLRGDQAAERLYRTRVRENDPEGRYAPEFTGLGSLSIASEPPGAEVFLFRFAEQSELDPEGEERLVPVPVAVASGADAATPIPPGSWALRVAQGAGGLVQGDVIVRVAGCAVQGTILIAGSHGPLRDFDRLVSIGGREVRDIHDANVLGKATPSGEPREFVFERDGATFTLSALQTEDLGVRVPSLAFLVEHYPAPLEVARDGQLLQLESVPGLGVRTTAAPLFPSPASSLGATPIGPRDLAQGSYLALLRRPGFESVRAPFVIERAHETRLVLRLDPAGTTPPGFVFVPGGPFLAGGDPQAYAAWPRATREVPDFWIGEREVTEREYVEFLNDPATQAEIAAAASLIRVPRTARDAASGGSWTRDGEGHYVVPYPNRNYALNSISPDDARAYAAWRAAQARAAGEPFEYALPSEEEWEKAARGADGRLFVCGNRYSPAWMKSLYARDGSPAFAAAMREPGLRFPVDESVYGAFDMAGNAWEACADICDPVNGGVAVRGGAATFMYEASFRVAARAGLDALEVQGQLGFRLVAHRRRGP